MVLKKKTKASSTGPSSAESVGAVDLHPKVKKIEKLDKLKKKKSSHPKDIKFLEKQDKKMKAVSDKEMVDEKMMKALDGQKMKEKKGEETKTKELRKDQTAMKRVKKRGDQQGFSHYIHKVLKSMQTNEPQSADSANKNDNAVKKCTLSTKGMAVCDSMMQELCDRLSTESISLLKQSNKKTLTAFEMRAAVRLTLPEDLANHAALDCEKAVANYNAQNAKVLKKRSSPIFENGELPEK